MKDYSEFTKNPEGYVLTYDFESNNILVYFATDKGQEPHEYKASKEIVEFMERKMADQYAGAIKKKKEILQKKIMPYIKTSAILIVLSALLSLFIALNVVTVSNLYVLIPLIFGVGSITTGIVLRQKENEKLNNQKKYLEIREQISNKISEDKNILEYLKRSAQKEIALNQKKKEKGLIENVCDVRLIDKMSSKDLKSIVKHYKMSKELFEPIKYKTSEDIKTKKRTRK